MHITISKRFKTVDKQVKSNSSVQLFLEVYYYQRIASHVYTQNIEYGIKIFTFLKLNEFDQFYKKKSVRFADTFSSRASLSAPRTRDLIVALRAPLFLDLALSAWSYAFRIHLSLFLIISYWSSNQFYNNITDNVNYIFSQSLNFFLNLSETGNLIYLKLYQP